MCNKAMRMSEFGVFATFFTTLQLDMFLECFFADGTLHSMFFDNTWSRFLENEGTGITDGIFALHYAPTPPPPPELFF